MSESRKRNILADELAYDWESKRDELEASLASVPSGDRRWLLDDALCQANGDHLIVCDPQDTFGATCAQPYTWRDPATLPRLHWLFGRYLLRGALALVAAPGGVGKTSWMTAVSLSLASGQAILGKPLYEGGQRVWLWGLEDDQEQLARQIAANAIHHGISEADCEGRLHVSSSLGGLGRDRLEMCCATQDDGEFKLSEDTFGRIELAVIDAKIDILIVDPFISSHSAREQDNGAMDAIAKRWALLAKQTNCAVVLVHHTRKTNGESVDVEAVRGAGALVNAARVVLLLNRMTPDQAAAMGVDEDSERMLTFSVTMGKSNRSAPGNDQWYRLESVSLGNGGESPSDEVGAVRAWQPADAMADVTMLQLVEAQSIVGGGEWRSDPRASDWVGKAVGHILGHDPGDKKVGRPKIRQIIDRWLADGYFRIERRVDPATRKSREFVMIGRVARAGDSADHGAKWMPGDDL